MITVGVDLASQPKRTAACRVHWTADGPRIVDLALGFDDEALARLFAEADKIAIDVPFGWPAGFVQAVAAYQHELRWPTIDQEELIFRATDRHILRLTGKRPLSVSADRIAFCAFRAARLLSRIVASGEHVDRSGTGRFVEVYPAAALRHWGLARGELAGEFVELDLLDRSDDELDALVAALVGRAAALELCEPIPAEDEEDARLEGWIALPQPGSLGRLR